MPSDIAPNAEEGVIQVRDRSGTGLPFSKGLMATSILATGLATDRAYSIAADIQRSLRDEGTHDIDADALSALAASVIETRAGAAVANRYLKWRRAKRTGRPVIVALGGVPGVGKSTLATRLAVRLGVTRVVTTDTIREVLRTVIPSTVLPELHVSTFERVAGLYGESAHGAFERQASAVVAATSAVASRLAVEQRSAIVEGVHLLPGRVRCALKEHAARPIVVEMTLVLRDGALHRSYLTRRRGGEPARGGERHLANFDAIRTLQSDLSAAARAAGVPVFDVEQPETLTQRIVDEVVRTSEMDPAP